MEQVHVGTLIIGAGMAGLSCAKRLANSGQEVLVVDKARGSGGRLSSKSLTLSDGQQIVFDLGCAGIAAQTPMFLQQIQHWQHADLIEPWRKVGGVIEYVGKSRNSVLTRHLADQLKTRFACRIEKLTLQDGQWQAWGREDDQLQVAIVADHVVLATPAEQATSLLPSDHAFCAQVGRVSTLPQWVVALVTAAAGFIPDELALLSQSPMLASIACDSEKPGRQSLSGKQVWQIQLRTDWSARHRDDQPDQIYQSVLDELQHLIGHRPDISDYYVHRWLYSSGHSQWIDDAECLWDGEQRIGVCGDYFHHPELTSDGVRRFGVESAFLSGCALAVRMGSSD